MILSGLVASLSVAEIVRCRHVTDKFYGSIHHDLINCFPSFSNLGLILHYTHIYPHKSGVYNAPTDITEKMTKHKKAI